MTLASSPASPPREPVISWRRGALIHHRVRPVEPGGRVEARVQARAALGIPADAGPVFVIGCILFGFGVGNLITLPGLIVQQEFPRRDFARAVSLNVAINQLVAALGPYILGVLHDLSGNYRSSLMVCLVLQAVAAILVLFRPRGSVRDA